LSKWREPFVKWVFWDTQNVVTQKASLLPEFAHELCAHHLLWMSMPYLDIGIPVACPPQSATAELLISLRHSELLLEMPLPPLVDIPVDLQNPAGLWSGPLPKPPPAGVALATIFEYTATTFGADRIPVLLATLPHHERWETLIPAVFGLSPDEFESGWHAFLAERYDIKP
jgi:hypothetical protein